LINVINYLISSRRWWWSWKNGRWCVVLPWKSTFIDYLYLT